MKLTNTLATVLFTLCTLLISSCSNDDDLAPISLEGLDSSNIGLSYPRSQEFICTLQGGDGSYEVICNKPDIVEAKIVPVNPSEKALSLTVLALGEATVTVTDNSQNTLVINVKVDYYTQNYLVSNYDVFINGTLEDSEKKAITEKALTTIPVKVGGGYKFIFTDEETTKGKVLMYKDKYGNNAIEGTFEIKIVESDEETGVIRRPIYELTFPEEKYNFCQFYYPRSSRMSVIEVTAFYEDVKEMFTADYPTIESVYTAQVLAWASDLFY
ncbi:hypothetical protein [Phocaeicola sp.]